MSGRHHVGCPDCDHPKHDGYECGAYITEKHRDTWRLVGKPTGETRVLIVDTCGCGWEPSGLDDEFHESTTRWTEETP